MTDQDRSQFAHCLAWLCAGLPGAQEIPRERAEVFFAELSDLDIEAIERGVRAWLRKDTPFLPSVGQLRAVCEGATEDRATLAWLDLVAEVRRKGSWQTPTLPEATMDTIRTMWGTWRNLCETLPGPDSPMFVATAKRFESSYRALAERRADANHLGPAEAKRTLASVLKGIDAHRRGLALASGSGKR
jgi:hypothetical protein